MGAGIKERGCRSSSGHRTCTRRSIGVRINRITLRSHTLAHSFSCSISRLPVLVITPQINDRDFLHFAHCCTVILKRSFQCLIEYLHHSITSFSHLLIDEVSCSGSAPLSSPLFSLPSVSRRKRADGERITENDVFVKAFTLMSGLKTDPFSSESQSSDPRNAQ